MGGIGVYYDGFLPWGLACGNYLRIILTRADTSDTSTLPSALISANFRLAVSPLRIIFIKVVTSVTSTFPSRLMRQSQRSPLILVKFFHSLAVWYALRYLGSTCRVPSLGTS